MVYHGHIENGAIVLDASAELPEGAAVKVELLPMRPSATAEQIPTLYDRLHPVIGQVDDLPSDASVT